MVTLLGNAWSGDTALVAISRERGYGFNPVKVHLRRRTDNTLFVHSEWLTCESPPHRGQPHEMTVIRMYVAEAHKTAQVEYRTQGWEN